MHTRNTWIIAGCLGAAFSGAAVAGLTAADATPSSIAAYMAVAEGSIKSVKADKSGFALQTEDGKSVDVKVDDKTMYTLDGKKVERDEALKVGHSAVVTHENGLASRVDVVSE